MEQIDTFDRHQFTKILDCFDDAFYLIIDDELVFSNKKFAQLFGINPEANLVGRTFFDASHSGISSLSLFSEMHKNLLKSIDESISWSQPSERIDHMTLWIEATVRKVILNGNKALLGTIRDVSHLQKLYSELSTANQTLMNLLDAFEDPIYAVTEDYEVVYANKTVRDIGEMSMAEHGLEGSWQQFPCYVFRGFKAPCPDCHNEEIFSGLGPVRWEFFHEYFRQWLAITELSVTIPGITKKTKLTMGRNITPWKNAEDRVRKLTHGLMNAQEAERKRLSRELHDDLSQQLCSMKLILGILGNKISNDGLNGKEQLQLLSTAMDNSLRTVKELAAGLRPPSFEEKGLDNAFAEHFEKFTSTHGLLVDFNSSGLDWVKLDEATSINLFRIVQEALHNVIKHADAKNIKVQIDAANYGIKLMIEDDGRGFDSDKFINSNIDEKHLGLAGISERVDSLNGNFRIVSNPGAGTRLNITTRFSPKNFDFSLNTAGVGSAKSWKSVD